MITTKDIDLSDLIGKPYKDNGRGPHFYDCWGLCLEVAHRLAQYLPEYDTPQNEDEKNVLFESIKDLQFKRLEKVQPWCLVGFRVLDKDGRQKWHAGTVLADCRRFIHITEKSFVCISRLNDPRWNLLLEGFYRYGS